MTARELRAKLDANPDVQTEKKPPENCPICGKKLPRLMRLELPDGFLCMDCAEKACKRVGNISYEELRCRHLAEIAADGLLARAEGGTYCSVSFSAKGIDCAAGDLLVRG